MPNSVFISYSRHNAPIARHLQHDLKRAGVSAWLDTADIPADQRWRPEIQRAIRQHSHFLLLASPESAASGEVGRELAEAEAQGKPVLTLHVGGTLAQLPPAWQERQLIALRDGYWLHLPLLLRALDLRAQQLPSLLDLLNSGQGSVADAAQELGGATPRTVAGHDYRILPVEPSGYTMTWIVAPAAAPLSLPHRLGVLLHFTGKDRDTLAEALAFFSDHEQQAVWMLYVEGPNRSGAYDLPLTSPHIWQDGVSAVARALKQPAIKARDLHLFSASPQPLVFAVAGKLREMSRLHLYQLEYGTSRYHHVLDSPA